MKKIEVIIVGKKVLTIPESQYCTEHLISDGIIRVLKLKNDIITDIGINVNDKIIIKKYYDNHASFYYDINRIVDGTRTSVICLDKQRKVFDDYFNEYKRKTIITEILND